VYLALPALLFYVIAHAGWTDVWQPGFVVAFGISSLMVFLSTFIIAWRCSDQLVDAAIMGLNASYPNTGFMGFPLAMTLFGHLSLPLTLIATIITVSVIFALAIV
jgi:malonate transporter